MEAFDGIKFQTGDIILYHGAKTWYEWGIEWFTGSKYSATLNYMKSQVPPSVG